MFADPPLPKEQYVKGHGRLQTRTALNEWVRWPGVGQVLSRCCERVRLNTGEVNREVTYGITSLSPEQTNPAALEALWRGHWCIENRVHYVRDVTMREDATQAFMGSTPQALAAICNALISLLRSKHWSCIADALRHYGASVHRALELIGAVPKPTLT